MAKKSEVVFNVNVVANSVEILNGEVESGDMGLWVTHKKPRSPKMMKTLIPMEKVISFQQGEDGYVVYREEEGSVDEMAGTLSESDIEGFILVTNEDGDKFHVRSGSVRAEAILEAEEVAPKKKAAAKKKPAQEEEAEEEVAPPKATRGKKAAGKKPTAKKAEPGDADADWED